MGGAKDCYSQLPLALKTTKESHTYVSIVPGAFRAAHLLKAVHGLLSHDVGGEEIDQLGAGVGGVGRAVGVAHIAHHQDCTHQQDFSPAGHQVTAKSAQYLARQYGRLHVHSSCQGCARIAYY